MMRVSSIWLLTTLFFLFPTYCNPQTNALEYLTTQLTDRISEFFPRLQGHVLFAKGREVYVDLGFEDGVKCGMELHVFRSKGDLKEIVRGVEVVGEILEKQGIVRVERVDKEVSLCTRPWYKFWQKFKQGDRIVYQGKTRIALLPFQAPSGKCALPSILREMLFNRLKGMDRFTLTPLDEVEEVLQSELEGDFGIPLPQSIAKKASEILSVDAILFGWITELDNKVYIDLQIIDGLNGLTLSVVSCHREKDVTMRRLLASKSIGVDVKGERGGRLRISMMVPMDLSGDLRFLWLYPYRLRDLILEGLFRWDGKTATPLLCERYMEMKDRDFFSIYIRKGVKFHTGDDMDAHDVSYSIKQGLKRHPQILDEFIGGVEAASDEEIRIYLKKAFPVLQEFLAFPEFSIIPKGAPQKALVGTGPFLIEDLEEERMRLSAHPIYWANPPLLEGIDCRVIPDEEDSLIELERGNLDMLLVPLQEVHRLKRDVSWQERVIEIPHRSIFCIGINCVQGPLANKTLRQALNYGIDKGAICKAIFSDFGWELDSFFLKDLGLSDGPSYQYDPRRAKRLIQAASPPTDPLHLLVLKNWLNLEIADQILLNLSTIGLDVVIKEASPAQYISLLQDESYDLLLFEYVGFGNAPSLNLYRAFYSGVQIPRPFSYKNTQLDSLLLSLLSERNEAKRKVLIGEIETIIFEDCPYVPLFRCSRFLAYQSSTKGLVFSHNTEMDFIKLWIDQ